MKKRSDSKFDPAYCKLARKICRTLNATDQELADFFEVARSTLSQWKVDHPEFARAVASGKLISDANVTESLYHRARGYSHEETKTFVHEGQVIEHTVLKHYPPDTMACMYWLNNRQRPHWKTRHNVEHTVLTEDIARAIELGMFNDEELEQISAGKLTRELLARISSAARAPADPGTGGT